MVFVSVENKGAYRCLTACTRALQIAELFVRVTITNTLNI